MGCGDVGSSISEDGKQSQSKLNANKTQPNDAESSDRVALRLEP
jgi:hypothetical protein